ncbi:hypothetical protein H4R20_001374 [Coemansia guatemalensis]|uniref:YEATS domain-containing protein n=1 Tax=Coemansia guatemalensis TaxID=2761395 RepID=A0A9W8HZK1_9FUNG|nr:hypothetical protein H4R20_001374 [Coemansia guatemalensis]
MTPDTFSEESRSAAPKRRRLHLHDEQARSRMECVVREQLDLELYLKQNEISTITSRLRHCETLLDVLESAIQAQTHTPASHATDGFKSYLRSLHDASLGSSDSSIQHRESAVRGRPRRAAAAASIPYVTDHHSAALGSSDEDDDEDEDLEHPSDSRVYRKGAPRVATLSKSLNSEQLDCVADALQFISSRRASVPESSSTDSESDSWPGAAVVTSNRFSTAKDILSAALLPAGPARDSRFHVIRRAILGNTSQYVDPQHRPPGNERCTHRWTVYIRGVPSDASPKEYIRKVRVFLHPSYRPDDIVDLASSSLELTRWGWGEFPVRIQIFFRDRRNKPIDLIHMLRLDNHRSGAEVVGSETPVDFELDRRGLVSEAGPAADAGTCSPELPPTNLLLRQLFQALCSLNPLVLDDAIPPGCQAPTCREQILDMVPSAVVNKWSWGVAVSPDIWHGNWPIGKRLAAENSRNRVLLKLISTALGGLSAELEGRNGEPDSAGAIALAEHAVRALFRCSNLDSVAAVATTADSIIDLVHRSDAATCSETVEMLLCWAAEHRDTRPLRPDRTRGLHQKQYAWSLKRWLRANGFVPLPILSADDLRSCILTQVPVHDGLGADHIPAHNPDSTTNTSSAPESAADFGPNGARTASKSNPEHIPSFFCNVCGVSLSHAASRLDSGHHGGVDTSHARQGAPAYCCRECQCIGNTKHFTTTRVAEVLDALPSGWDQPEAECNADFLLTIDDDNVGDNDKGEMLARPGGASKQTRAQIERFAAALCADPLFQSPAKASVLAGSKIGTGGGSSADSCASFEALEDSDDRANQWSNVDDEAIDWIWNTVRPLELNCATASRLSIVDSSAAGAAPSNKVASDLVHLPNGSDGAFEEALTQHLPVGRLLLDAMKMFLNDLVTASDKVMRENHSAQAPKGRESPADGGTLTLTPLHVLAAVKQNPRMFDVCSNAPTGVDHRTPSDHYYHLMTLYILRRSTSSEEPVGDAVWSARAVGIFSTLGVYVLLTITTTVIIIYRYARTNDELLVRRSMPLVLFQALLGIAVGAASLVGSALHYYPCVLKLWVISFGVLLWFLVVAARATQHFFLLWPNTAPTPSSEQSISEFNKPAARDCTEGTPAASVSAYYRDVNGVSHRPGTVQTRDLWTEYDSSTLRLSRDKSLLSEAAPYYTCHPHPRAERWIVSSRMLLMALAFSASLLAVLTLAISFRSPALSARSSDLQAACLGDGGWETWLPYSIAIACAGLAFPALELMIWSIGDLYNTQADILICMFSSQVTLVVYALWETLFAGIRVYLSELFVIWLAALATHVSSVCWPLWQSIKRKRQQEALVPQSGIGSSYRGARPRRSIYASLYREFQLTLEDSVQRERFFAFAAQYYRSALPSFLGDFQLLKYQVLEALMDDNLRNAGCSQYACSNASMSTIPARLAHEYKPVCASAITKSVAQWHKKWHPVQIVSSIQRPHDSHPLAKVVPVTKGIFESAVLLLPPKTIDEKTPFPETTKNALSNLVCTYLASGSCMSVNIPSSIVEGVQAAVEQGNVALSVLDHAKDEVLFLLCTDVYMGYCMRLESQGHSSA